MKTIPSLFILLCATIVLLSMKTLNAQVHKMYVGTYTSNSDSKGVYVYDFDEKSGKAKFVKNIAMSNPSFLARNANILYAVNEDTQGMLTAYDLNNNKVISHVSTGGAHPCHISLSPKDPIAVVSNYSSGSLNLFSLHSDGSIKEMDDFLKFKGSSVDKERQNQSHIHSAFFSKDGSLVYVSDLGADLIYVLEIVNNDGKYTFKKIKEIKTKLGGGPRHLVLSNDEKSLYSILELTGEVQVFHRSSDNWISKQIVPMYPADFEGEHGGADIKISKDGKRIIATNRGTANYVIIYKVKRDGKLQAINLSSVHGDSPRNVNFSPNENYIFTSNQITNDITIFNIPPTNTYRYLDYKGNKIEPPKPVCVIF